MTVKTAGRERHTVTSLLGDYDRPRGLSYPWRLELEIYIEDAEIMAGRHNRN